MSTVNLREINNFRKLSNEWSNDFGSFKMLHAMNRIRLSYIMRNLRFKEGNLLDIGCGGGLASAPMARHGFSVMAVDPVSENITATKKHTRGINNIEFLTRGIEDIKGTDQFNVILALEVIEHVEDIEMFISSISRLLKPGGQLFISTINRTVKSALQAIIAAEYLLKWVPIGTHQWSKFYKPSEICACLRKYRIKVEQFSGMKYNPLTQKWRLSNNVNVNYILTAQAT